MQDRAGTISVVVQFGDNVSMHKRTFNIAQSKFVDDLLQMIWEKEGKRDTECGLYYPGEPGNRRKPATWLERDKQLRFYKVIDEVCIFVCNNC